jgi:hypothetical protein
MNINSNITATGQLELTQSEIDYLERLCCINKKSS